MLQRHAPVIRIAHWTIAVLVVAMLGMSALVMAEIRDGSAAKLQAAMHHMLAGAVVIVAFVLRLHMRHRVARPPEASSGMPWADWLGRLVHRLLDVLVGVMICSGLAMMLAGHLLQRLVAGGVFPPGLQGSLAHQIHVAGAWCIGVVLVLHIGGALFHQFVLRDRLLARMLIGPREARAAFGHWRSLGMPLVPPGPHAK